MNVKFCAKILVLLEILGEMNVKLCARILMFRDYGRGECKVLNKDTCILLEIMDKVTVRFVLGCRILTTLVL